MCVCACVLLIDALCAGDASDGRAQVRIYEIGPNGQSQGKAMFSCQGPVLSVCWSKVCSHLPRILISNTGTNDAFPVAQDGNKVIAGGADNAARMVDLQANPNQAQQVAQHDAPIKVVKWIESPQGGILVTGSWDKTVKVCRTGPRTYERTLLKRRVQHSIGTSGRRTRLRRSSCRSAVTRSTSCIRSWSSDVRSGTCRSSTSLTLAPSLKYDHSLLLYNLPSLCSPALSAEHAIPAEVANSSCFLLHPSERVCRG